MKWIEDRTGKFKKRPHYSSLELDVECETIFSRFLIEKYGKPNYPISTDDITILVEKSTQDFDSCKDLTGEGSDVEGITYFARGQKPIVCISNRLQNPSYENRLRTTLTHELFHVLFHDFLYQTDNQQSLFEASPNHLSGSSDSKCKRDNILGASKYDWMEWQAGYGCGAFLIPISLLSQSVQKFKSDRNLLFERILVDSIEGKDLIRSVSKSFQTSEDAARVRLLQKEMIVENHHPRVNS